MALPTSLESEIEKIKVTTSDKDIILENLPKGMGVTLSIFLRRILLDYIPSIGVFGVKIEDLEGVKTHQFGTLKGLTEVTLDFIINLKKIILKEKNPIKGIFFLDLDIKNEEESPKIIKASDFSSIPEVEIKNPDLYLATLETGSKLKVRLYFQKSWGFHFAMNQKKSIWWKEYFDKQEGEDKDVIALDTDYSLLKGRTVNSEWGTEIKGITTEEEKAIITIKENEVVEKINAFESSLNVTQKIFNHLKNCLSNSLTDNNKTVESKKTRKKTKKDYYQILEISETATPEEIKKAYKKLAKKWHPDKNLDNIKEAEARMKEINEAYEILSDEDRRREYDKNNK